MIIKDLQTGESHEYGTDPHDSLVVSEDGRTLSFYNLQNGDGSRFGDYRFVADWLENYWNIGGFEKSEITEEDVKEFCRKRCLHIVTNDFFDKMMERSRG